jgi:hypothetical protein
MPSQIPIHKPFPSVSKQKPWSRYEIYRGQIKHLPQLKRESHTDISHGGSNPDFNSGVSLLREFALEELVQLSIEDTVGHELAALRDSSLGSSHDCESFWLIGLSKNPFGVGDSRYLEVVVGGWSSNYFFLKMMLFFEIRR